MKFRLLQGMVLIEAIKEDDTSKGGIVIPEKARKILPQGKVLAVGPGRLTKNSVEITPGVNVGDTVVYDKFSGTEIKIGGKTFLIIKGIEIPGILT